MVPPHNEPSTAALRWFRLSCLRKWYHGNWRPQHYIHRHILRRWSPFMPQKITASWTPAWSTVSSLHGSPCQCACVVLEAWMQMQACIYAGTEPNMDVDQIILRVRRKRINEQSIYMVQNKDINIYNHLFIRSSFHQHYLYIHINLCGSNIWSVALS